MREGSPRRLRSSRVGSERMMPPTRGLSLPVAAQGEGGPEVRGAAVARRTRAQGAAGRVVAPQDGDLGLSQGFELGEPSVPEVDVELAHQGGGGGVVD